MDIAAWLRELGLERYEQAFRGNDIDAEILPKLTAEDLSSIGVTSVGHRRKLLEAIAVLNSDPVTGPTLDEEETRTKSRPPSGARRAPSGAERRQLTVLFCDLVGSTELAAQLDPEDMSGLIRAYQNAVAGEITRFEGHIAKFMGDGVLAYFGWPRAHENEAERAVRSGLAITAAIGQLSDPTGEALAARVAIATGLVVVGDLVGEGAAQEQAVVGDTPNLAARLQAVAAPGQVVIADATRRLLGAGFELRHLGEHELKGISGPVPAFAVTGERPVESRFEVMSGPTLSPMVGRDQELALLLERWELAKAGEGQGVLLVGEAGIGKSRITRALLDALAEEPHLRIRYQCSPYHTESALWPVIQQLDHAAGLGAEDPLEVRLDKLEMLLERAGGRDAVPLIADLLGLDGAARYGPLELEPQTQRARTLRALAEQLGRLAARQSVLAVLEDAHWIDPTTLELIEQCLDRIATARVLLLMTSRPHRQPEVAAHPHVTRLTLNRLSRVGVEAIVARLGGDRLPGATIDAIIARTDGVPLFVEELTKAVLETGEASIPASLHDSLMARLDRIPEVKEVAQIAACIGREFDYPLLAAIAGLPEAAVHAALDKLTAAELIFRRGSPPDALYSFKHALVRDAAYGTILRSRRQKLHARIAQALVERFASTTSSEPELVAHHFSEAGMVEEAVEYWHRAGERAVKRSANLEAIQHLQVALELLASLPHDRRRAERELRLLTLLNPALMVIKGPGAEEVATTLERARRAGRELQSLDHIIPATLGLWLFHNNRGDFGRARALTQELFELAKQRDDDGFLLQAHHAAWTTPFFTGDFAQVRDHVGRGLALYDEQRHRGHALIYIGHDPAVCAHALGAVALWMLGFPDQALRHSARAITRGEQSSHPPTLAHALWYVGNLHVLRNDHVAVAELAERYLSISAEFGMAPGVATADSLAGWAEARDGKVEAGLARLQRGVEAWKATGSSLHLPQRLSLLAEGLGLAGRAAEALDLNAEAHRVAQSTGGGYYQAVILWQRGWLLGLDAVGLEQAEAAFGQTLEVARRQQAKSLELRAATRLARLWRDRGKQTEARDLLAPVYGWFTEGFDTADLKEAKALLDELA